MDLNKILVVILLLLVMKAYLLLARRLNIIDKPNHRSSHDYVTIRGGGIIFPAGILLWFLMNGIQLPYLVLGVVLISAISFLDDIRPLPTGPRLLVHLIAVLLLIYDLGLTNWSWYWWLLSFVLIIGWLNAFNFMDGINGITAFYSLSVIVPIYLLNLNLEILDSNLIIMVSISVLIFAFFNARKKAVCFAGDVGSISMAYILAYFVATLIIATGHWEYILLLAVYGVDTVLTIIQRLLKGENIFKAHRSHLYQYLANEIGWGHLKVAALYGVVQLGISALILFPPTLLPIWVFAILLLAVLVLVYLLTKRRILQRISLAKP